MWVPVCGYFCVWKKIVCVKKKWSHWRSPVKAGCGCRGRPVRGADNLAVEMARQQGYGLPPGPPSSCRALRSRVSFPMAPRDLDPKPEILCCRAQQPFSRGVAPSKENDTSKAGRGWEDQATFAQGDQGCQARASMEAFQVQVAHRLPRTSTAVQRALLELHNAYSPRACNARTWSYTEAAAGQEPRPSAPAPAPAPLLARLLPPCLLLPPRPLSLPYRK